MSALLASFSSLGALAGTIDYTNLDLGATDADIRQLCAQALEWGFASVCVRPSWVSLAAELLRGSMVRVCTVISFHEGRDSIDDKAAEARAAIARGAQEIDWVFSYENLIEFRAAPSMSPVHVEVEAIATLAQEFPDVVLKVIIECCALDDELKRWICSLLANTYVIHFVKTSTGFGTPRQDGVPKGATVGDVVLLRSVINDASPMDVKASGGIRDLDTLLAMHGAGAMRFGIGHVAALSIMEAARAEGLAA